VPKRDWSVRFRAMASMTVLLAEEHMLASGSDHDAALALVNAALNPVQKDGGK